MKLLRLAAWTVWFMLCWTALAHADPVSAIIAGIAGILKAGGIGAMLIKAAFGIALQVGASLLQKAMAKKQPQPGITGQLQVGGNNSLSFIVGHFATAGSLDYVNTGSVIANKTPNNTLVQVITVSDLPVTAIKNTVWINGEKCTRSTSASVPSDNGGRLGSQSYPLVEYKDGAYCFMFARYFLGDQTTALSELVTMTGSDPERPWQSDMIGRGTAYVALSAYVNRRLLTSIPSARFEVDGIKLYDPRKDSTVGGSGSHRWGVPSTYEFSANPVVIIYNLLRGIWYDGELIYGPAIPASRLPLDSWFAAMNECDVSVSVAGGGTEPQFRAGYEIKVAEHQPIDVIQELLKGCNGKMIEVGGVYKIHVGAPALPVYFVTDEDFVVTDEQEFDPFLGLENTFNGAAATYPEPSAGWEMKDAPQRLFPDYVEEDDDRERLADFQFNAVPFPTQVQRLMKSMVEDGRRFRKHRGTLPPSAFILEPLDVISWTSVREGYVDKLFPIDSMDDLVNANQAVAVREADPSDFDWNFETDELPWSVGPLVPQWPVAQIMTGWSVEPAEFRDSAGNARRPSIKVNYPGDSEDVSDVIVRVRLAEDESQVFYGKVPYGEIFDGSSPITLKSVILNGTFLPDEDYEVQGEFVPYSGRGIEPTDWMPVTTPDVRLGADDIFPDEIVQEVIESVEAGKRFVSQPEARAVRDAMLAMATLTVEQDGQNVLDKRELQLSLQTAVQGKADLSLVQALGGSITEIDGKVTIQGAAVTALEAALEGYTGVGAVASAFSGQSVLITGIGDELTAVSESLLLTEATVGKFSASGLLRAEQIATMSGAQSTIAIAASASAGGDMTSAALVLNALSGGIGEIGLIAGRVFVATDAAGTGKTGLFVIDSGTVYIDKARIKGLTAAQIDVETLLAETVFTNSLVVQTHNIALGSIMKVTGASVSIETAPTVETTRITRTISNPSGGPVFFWLRSQGAVAPGAGIIWSVWRGSTLVFQNGTENVGYTIYDSYCDRNAPTGNVTYEVKVLRGGGNATWGGDFTVSHSLR